MTLKEDIKGWKKDLKYIGREMIDQGGIVVALIGSVLTYSYIHDKMIDYCGDHCSCSQTEINQITAAVKKHENVLSERYSDIFHVPFTKYKTNRDCTLVDIDFSYSSGLEFFFSGSDMHYMQKFTFKQSEDETKYSLFSEEAPILMERSDEQ